VGGGPVGERRPAQQAAAKKYRMDMTKEDHRQGASPADR
jgi:hypothetical protein